MTLAKKSAIIIFSQFLNHVHFWLQFGAHLCRPQLLQKHVFEVLSELFLLFLNDPILTNPLIILIVANRLGNASFGFALLLQLFEQQLDLGVLQVFLALLAFLFFS